jgi:hypothetical protein
MLLDREPLECIRRTNPDVDALVVALLPRLPRESDALIQLRQRVTASCRRAILSPAGRARDEAWREFCRGIAALLTCVPAGIESAGAEFSRLRALLAENADVLC